MICDKCPHPKGCNGFDCETQFGTNRRCLNGHTFKEPPKPRSKTKEQKLIERIEVLFKHLTGLQAKIDALMLEFCPDEMTKEQLADREARK